MRERDRHAVTSPMAPRVKHLRLANRCTRKGRVNASLLPDLLRLNAAAPLHDIYRNGGIDALCRAESPLASPVVSANRSASCLQGMQCWTESCGVDSTWVRPSRTTLRTRASSP